MFFRPVLRQQFGAKLVGIDQFPKIARNIVHTWTEWLYSLQSNQSCVLSRHHCVYIGAWSWIWTPHFRGMRDDGRSVKIGEGIDNDTIRKWSTFFYAALWKTCHLWKSYTVLTVFLFTVTNSCINRLTYCYIGTFKAHTSSFLDSP